MIRPQYHSYFLPRTSNIQLEKSSCSEFDPGEIEADEEVEDGDMKNSRRMVTLI